MNLLLNGASLPAGQLGPDFLLLRDSVEHPPAKATLVVGVQKTERRWAVRLPEGISATSRRVLIAKA